MAQLEATSVFIGLQNENGLFWVDNDPVSFLNYKEGEPNGYGAEHCTGEHTFSQ